MSIMNLLSDELANETKKILDNTFDELTHSQNDVIKKILGNYGFSVDYVKQHKEEFKVVEVLYPSSGEHAKNYMLLHNENPIGEWHVRMAIDFNDSTLKVRIYYKIL